MKMRDVGEILTGIQSQLSLLFLLTLDIHRNTNMKHRRMILGLMGLCFAALAPYCWGQSNYPDRPVRLVIPFPPGGPSDVLGRSLAQKLTERLGQQFVVDNRPGAGGSIAVDLTTRAAPDGHTLLFSSSTFVTNQLLYKVNYDTLRDLAPVSLASENPYVFAVNAEIGRAHV